MNLTEKQINNFLNTLVQIVEDRKNVKIDFLLKKGKIKNEK